MSLSDENRLGRLAQPVPVRHRTGLQIVLDTMDGNRIGLIQDEQLIQHSIVHCDTMRTASVSADGGQYLVEGGKFQA